MPKCRVSFLSEFPASCEAGTRCLRAHSGALQGWGDAWPHRIRRLVLFLNLIKKVKATERSFTGLALRKGTRSRECC